MKTGIPFLFAASIGFAAAALAQPAGKPPQVIDINGVRIGMSPAEATAAIGATGMPNIHRGGRDFFIDKVRFNNRDDMVFVSALRSEIMGDPPSYTGGNRIGRRILSVSFLPDPGRERVWGIGHSRTYRLAEAPSVANTLEALVDNSGDPQVHKGLSTANFIRGVPAGQRTSSGTMIWYWTDAGAPMDRKLSETCFGALDNSFVGLGGPDVGLYNGVTLESSLTKRHWQAGRRAGCGRVIHAALFWNQDGVLTELRVGAIDLKLAYDAAVTLSNKIAAQEDEAAKARLREADRRRPGL